jgi:hypothetical protein
MRNCGDCGAMPGELHQQGCDVERCPRCGCQMISCDCVYEVNGIDPATMEEDHPEVYANGPAPEMYAKWDAEWGPRRLPWTGEWPGDADAIALGWYARMVPGVTGWYPCGKDDPGAMPDLTRLMTEGRWDADRGRWIARDAQAGVRGPRGRR